MSIRCGYKSKYRLRIRFVLQLVAQTSSIIIILCYQTNQFYSKSLLLTIFPIFILFLILFNVALHAQQSAGV